MLEDPTIVTFPDHREVTNHTMGRTVDLTLLDQCVNVWDAINRLPWLRPFAMDLDRQYDLFKTLVTASPEQVQFFFCFDTLNR
jgi:D-alanyl-D-alanine dipeptidase